GPAARAGSCSSRTCPRTASPTASCRGCGSTSACSSSPRTPTSRCWSGSATSDRKSTRLNSSHVIISYAVFCLKKKTTHVAPATPDLPGFLSVHRHAAPRPLASFPTRRSSGLGAGGPGGELQQPHLPEDRFADRELSWLRFNERVLELAEDPDIPLLERVRYL